MIYATVKVSKPTFEELAAALKDSGLGHLVVANWPTIYLGDDCHACIRPMDDPPKTTAQQANSDVTPADELGNNGRCWLTEALGDKS